MFVAPFSMRDTDDADLDLNFMASSLDSRCTFSRGSVATDIINGVLTSFASGQPRTSVANGLLVENSRTNNSADNTKTVGNCTYSSANQTGPDNILNSAGTCTIDASANNHFLTGSSLTFTATTYTVSTFVKMLSGTPRIQLAIGGSASSAYANFSITGSGSVLASGGAVSSGIIALSNGWYRIWLTATCAAATAVSIALFFINSDTATRGPTYTGNGTDAFAVFGFQNEAAVLMSSYIPTTTAAATRQGDDVRAPMSWFNTAQGTVLVEALRPSIDSVTNQRMWALRDSGAGSNSHSVRFSLSTGVVSGLFFSNNTSDAVPTIASANWPVGTVKRLVYGWAQDDVGLALGGLTPVLDNTTPNGPPQNIVRMFIGANNPSGSEALNGYVRRIKCWSRKKPTAQLQALSA